MSLHIIKIISYYIYHALYQIRFKAWYMLHNMHKDLKYMVL